MHALRLERPFAHRPGERGVRRLSSRLEPGDVAVIARETGPPARPSRTRCAWTGHVELAIVIWSSRDLPLLSGERESDFVVLPLRHEE